MLRQMMIVVTIGLVPSVLLIALLVNIEKKKIEEQQEQQEQQHLVCKTACGSQHYVTNYVVDGTFVIDYDHGGLFSYNYCIPHGGTE